VFHVITRSRLGIPFIVPPGRFYSIAQGGSVAAGYSGMSTRLKKIKNVDVTKQVPDHSEPPWL
jgi:hypothetical protein